MEEQPPNLIIMAALSTLSPSHLSTLSHSLSSDIHRRRRRLSILLSSPTLFSLTLRHLNSLSLSHKTLLISRFLLSTLRRLSLPFQSPLLPQHPSPAASLTPRDLDAALLLFLCEVRQHHPDVLDAPLAKWRPSLCHLYSISILTLSGLPISNTPATVLLSYIDTVTRCWKFIGFIGRCGGGSGGGGGKVMREVAASPMAVVELPSVDVRGGGGGDGVAVECVICKEEIEGGRDACQLPCDHLFHWLCILPWLRKRNTCPCCRFRLPTDDIFGEIQRLWEILIRASDGC